MTLPFRPKRPRDMRFTRPLFCADCGDVRLYFTLFDDRTVCAECGTVHLIQTGVLIRADEYPVWTHDKVVIVGRC